MSEENKTGQEQQTEEIAKVKFKGQSGKEFEIDPELYNDFKAMETGKTKAIQSKYEKEMSDLKAQFEETNKQFSELKKSTMSEKERAELANAEREKALYDAQMSSEKNYKMYSDYRVKNEIARVVNKHADRLNAPEYIPIIIENMFKPELKNESIVCGESTLEETFENFLKSESSKSLLKNTLTSGSSTPLQTQSNNVNKSLNYKSSDVANDPAIRRQYMAEVKAGKQPKLVD